MIIKIEPMRYHGPSWTASAPNGIEYMVWSPRESRPRMIDGKDFGPKARDFWQSHWDDGTEFGSDGRRADTLDEVLDLFSPEVADAFRAEIDRWQTGQVDYSWDDLAALKS